MITCSFIHSGHFYNAPFKSSTTQRRSQLQHGYCIGVSCRSAQATVGKGLAQGPYMAARAGVEPMTLRLKVIISTNAPPCPATFYRCHSLSVVGLLIIWQNTLIDFVWASATIMIDSLLVSMLDGPPRSRDLPGTNFLLSTGY